MSTVESAQPEKVVTHYREFTIEVLVHKLANGQYTAQGDFKKSSVGDVQVSRGFDTGRELPSKGAAAQVGIELGKKRVDELLASQNG